MDVEVRVLLTLAALAAPHTTVDRTLSWKQDVVVADDGSKPTLYTDWTPSRIAVWLRPKCED